MSEDSAPLLHVVRGEPTDAELAAVTAVLLSRGTAGVAEPPAASGGWGARADGVRRTLPKPGPGAWRRSGSPFSA